MDSKILDQRLATLESRLARLEFLLEELGRKLEQSQLNTETAKEGIKAWVTDYVSLRLTQLVPETCEHVLEAPTAEGPVLPGTRVRCTEEVVHRLGRIPIPFVRQMVTQKVADTARAEGVALVDITFFERAATF
ncbi:MAG: hypothetical protein ACE5JN_07560 [Candidatus Methylomirabilia bacterium]